MIFGVLRDAFASRLAPTWKCIPNVGASLLAKGASAFNKSQEGFFSIRNALALASTTKYITTVINNGNRK